MLIIRFCVMGWWFDYWCGKWYWLFKLLLFFGWGWRSVFDWVFGWNCLWRLLIWFFWLCLFVVVCILWFFRCWFVFDINLEVWMIWVDWWFMWVDFCFWKWWCCYGWVCCRVRILFCFCIFICCWVRCVYDWCRILECVFCLVEFCFFNLRDVLLCGFWWRVVSEWFCGRDVRFLFCCLYGVVYFCRF